MNKYLEDLAVIHSGKDYKNNPNGDNIPIYGTGGIMGFTSIPLNYGPAILTGRKGTINNPMYVEGGFWNVDTIFCIKAKDAIDVKWLFYHFQNTDLSKLNEATGVPSVSSKALYRLEFRWVNLLQQNKIVKILNVADAIIERTKSTIAKYKAIKQGMIHDLFTRGMDIQTGKLRPKYEEAPELYKKSKLGWIPKEWVIDRLDSICEINPTGNLPAYLKPGDEVSFIRMEDVSNDAEIVSLNTRKIKDVSKRGFTPFNENDILFAKITPCMENGKGALVMELKNKFGFGSTEFHVLKAREKKSTLFLFYLSTSSKFRLQAEGKMSGSAGQQRVPNSFLKEYLLGIPSIEEQYQIGLRLHKINSKIKAEQAYLKKIENIKIGLMNDLLSEQKVHIY